MPKGKCLKCGKVYHGWALNYRKYRICPCEGHIIIIESYYQDVKE